MIAELQALEERDDASAGEREVDLEIEALAGTEVEHAEHADASTTRSESEMKSMPQRWFGRSAAG